MNRWLEGFKQVRNYPSAVVGLALIALLAGVAIYTILFLSFEEALDHWRARDDVVRFNPRTAYPVWINWFGYDLPETIILTSEDDATIERDEDDDDQFVIKMEFDYTSTNFPSEMNIYFEGKYEESAPFARIYWFTPEGERYSLGSHRVSHSHRVTISQEERLERRFGGRRPHVGLLMNPTYDLKASAFELVLPDLGEIARVIATEDDEELIAFKVFDLQPALLDEDIPIVVEQVRAQLEAGVTEESALQRHFEQAIEEWREAPPVVMQGTYRIEIHVELYEDDSEVSATYVCHGRVHGLAGTDNSRRDLMVALLWGTPVALAFGLLAAVGTTITTLIIAAIGVWFGGWIDAIIQRVTEVNMILPLLPILVMIGTLYSQSIWVMLGVVIILGIFSAGVKMYRAMLLPIREAPYIEAARAYGAGNMRIVFRYMIPRVLPVLIPSFVTLIPTYVFLEASLAVLSLGDPILPTWGKVLHEAYVNDALIYGYYHWVLGPALMLMITGLGFAMLGFALDRIFNPRLRQI